MNMIEIESWAAQFAGKLKEEFGGRLEFLGYQGSYGRGEAGPDSDIDMVAVLDQVELSDLARYRKLVGEMPSGELACGFLCGREELRGWPKFDLLGLVLDTKPVLGDLKALAPEPGPEDVRQALVIGASGLYHGAVHSFLYGDRAADLPGLRKSAFFCLRIAYLYRTGEYAASRKELLQKLDQPERAVLTEQNPYQAYRLMIEWSGRVLKNFSQTP